MTDAGRHDAVVIGGGFYGAAIASYLVRQRGLKRVALVERERQLLARASFHNQARVHNGYHYPRSFTTAYRSRINLPRFVTDWPQAVRRDFQALYAIARRNSRVTARQFERFCREIGAPLRTAPPAQQRLFEPRLIEQVFEVEEYAFDATALRHWAGQALREDGVELHLATSACGVERRGAEGLSVRVRPAGLESAAPHSTTDPAADSALPCRIVVNCTYSGLNQIGSGWIPAQQRLKHELTEMALVDCPAALRGVGLTVMDGPFFSVMPFPSRGLHTLSHVRYTPHLHFADAPGADPYRRLSALEHASRFDRMQRDAARYLPVLAQARQVDSLFEVKTVLLKNEGDDGRPILFERHEALPGCYSVLGGKIDNIYDALERLDAELL
jgi:glycine/D-amino acid oxidase-like deaminating enzyme